MYMQFSLPGGQLKSRLFRFTKKQQLLFGWMHLMEKWHLVSRGGA